jgi:hypothetical protein
MAQAYEVQADGTVVELKADEAGVVLPGGTPVQAYIATDNGVYPIAGGSGDGKDVYVYDTEPTPEELSALPDNVIYLQPYATAASSLSSLFRRVSFETTGTETVVLLPDVPKFIFGVEVNEGGVVTKDSYGYTDGEQQITVTSSGEGHKGEIVYSLI